MKEVSVTRSSSEKIIVSTNSGFLYNTLLCCNFGDKIIKVMLEGQASSLTYDVPDHQSVRVVLSNDKKNIHHHQSCGLTAESINMEQQTTWISIHTVIIGGGQAGLAMSRCLMDRSVDHVILERGQIGERWRSSYWDSLRLLTPKWQSRLPGGYAYRGSDGEGFFTSSEFVEYLEDYANSFQAPVRAKTNVRSVEEIDDPGQDLMRFKITTESGPHWFARNVVVATGYCDIPKIPNVATTNLDHSVMQLTAADYRNPSQILDRKPPMKNGSTILVVGSGASGLQIAQELAVAAQNHPAEVKIILSAGRHIRWPRSYRGKDILWWMDQIGAFRASAIQEEEAASPGPQLMGCSSPADISLYHLKTQHRVEIVGKVKNIEVDAIKFDNEILSHNIEEADDECVAIMKTIDYFIRDRGLNCSNTPGLTRECADHDSLCPRLKKHTLETSPDTLDLTKECLVCVIWATGFIRNYPFLSGGLTEALWDPARHNISNEGGVTSKPGMYVLGYRWMRRKYSNFVDGVGTDANDISNHLVDSTLG